MILLDVNGTILTWNKGVEKLKGYSANEIIGQHISMFYLPLDRERKLPEKLLEEAKEKGVARHVGRRVRKNGTIFWGSIEIAAIKDVDGKVIGFTKLARELNEVFDFGHFWFDNEGILHIKASKYAFTPERIKEFRTLLFEAAGDHKVCCIADMREAILTEDGTVFSMSTLGQFYKAMAFITEAKKDENTKKLLKLLPEGIASKTFTNRNEAIDWIRQYL